MDEKEFEVIGFVIRYQPLEGIFAWVERKEKERQPIREGDLLAYISNVCKI